MKNLKLIITFFFAFAISYCQAQENCITVSGGYAFANVEDIDGSSTGWRINVLYEYAPMESNLSHGVNFGYIHTSATIVDSGIGSTESEFKAGHWPIYYVPKYTFLAWESTFRPFVKGALGMHFSDYDKTGPLGGSIDTGDTGFYGGLGAGLDINISERTLLNLEYEWAYLSNSWYRDGFINSLMLGIGFKF
jgi:opacity protein-like surface antigen